MLVGQTLAVKQGLVGLCTVESVAAAHDIWNLRTGFEGTIYRTGCGGYPPGGDQFLMKRK